MKLTVAVSPEPDPLADYPAEFAACRVDRHRWARRARWVQVAANVSERIRQCEGCGTMVVQTVNTRTWSRMGPARYRYAPGYAMRGKGLVLEDYRARHLAADFGWAERTGRVDEQ